MPGGLALGGLGVARLAPDTVALRPRDPEGRYLTISVTLFAEGFGWSRRGRQLFTPVCYVAPDTSPA